MPDLLSDSEARFEYLVEHGVLAEREDGTVVTTDDFEGVRGIYYDSYLDLSDERFQQVLAEAFELSTDEARERIDQHGVTREELATYLALSSYLDDDRSRDELALLAAMAERVDPGSPVPEGMDELHDDEYAEYIDEQGDVVVFVWKRECAPCEAMKEDLDEIRAAAPARVAFAGVDGEAVSEFRREFEVDAAPTTLVFADGELVERLDGRRSPDDLADAFADAYGSDETGTV